jgi:hypothetical protein
VVEMMRIYRGISRKVPGILLRVGTRSLFSARVFAELVLAAQAFTGSLRDSHTAI